MALCYAELSSAFPITGGEYAFAARTLGRSTGFALFALGPLGGVLTVAVIALGTGDYLGVVWGSLGGKRTGLAVIALASLVAVLGIRLNAWVTGVFLAVELAAIAVLAWLGDAVANAARTVGQRARFCAQAGFPTVVAVGRRAGRAAGPPAARAGSAAPTGPPARASTRPTRPRMSVS